MTIPGRLTIVIALVLALLLLGAVVEHLLVLIALAGDGVLLAICLAQGQQLKRLKVEVTRDDWARAQVGSTQSLPYKIANRSTRGVIVRLRQEWPAGVEARERDVEIAVDAGEIVQVALEATPRQRGTMAIPAAEVDIRFSADFARVRQAVSPGELKVFPSLRGMSEYEALRRHHMSSYAGLHQQRQLGAGREFEQLRDYFADDDFRDINWKATARRRHPITNMYQAERSRDLVLCLDCGRMMGNPVGAGTALDHAIDAAIMLAHVANRQSDRVGLVLFRDIVTRFIKPAGGLNAVHRLIEELVDAQPQGVFPSYGALMTSLRAHQTRRSVVFLFTDLNDPQLAANLVDVLPVASRKHVLVVISLRDPLLDKVASGPAADGRGLYQVLAARQLATERATRTRELHRIGATVIEADAGSLTMKLLNAYLSIKTRQLV